MGQTDERTNARTGGRTHEFRNGQTADRQNAYEISVFNVGGQL